MEKSFNRLSHMCRCDRVSIWQSLDVLLIHVNSYSHSDSAYVFLYNRSWSMGSYSQSEMQTLSENAGLYTNWLNFCKQNECVKMLRQLELLMKHAWFCMRSTQWWATFLIWGGGFFSPPLCSDFEKRHLKSWASILWPNINMLLLFL